VIAQYSTDTNSGIGAVFWLFTLALWVLYIVATWRLYEKAGQPGWASLIRA
jgi:hypothetical protein